MTDIISETLQEFEAQQDGEAPEVQAEESQQDDEVVEDEEQEKPEATAEEESDEGEEEAEKPEASGEEDESEEEETDDNPDLLDYTVDGVVGTIDLSDRDAVRAHIQKSIAGDKLIQRAIKRTQNEVVQKLTESDGQGGLRPSAQVIAWVQQYIPGQTQPGAAPHPAAANGNGAAQSPHQGIVNPDDDPEVARLKEAWMDNNTVGAFDAYQRARDVVIQRNLLTQIDSRTTQFGTAAEQKMAQKLALEQGLVTLDKNVVKLEPMFRDHQGTIDRAKIAQVRDTALGQVRAGNWTIEQANQYLTTEARNVAKVTKTILDAIRAKKPRKTARPSKGKPRRKGGAETAAGQDIDIYDKQGELNPEALEAWVATLPQE